MDETPNLTLPYIMAAQAQKHVTHNEAIRMLDAVVQLSVKDQDLAAPPGSPLDGDRYIVGASATDDWSGKEDQVAAYQDNAWIFYQPLEGWVAWVADEDKLLVWDGFGWGNVSTDTSEIQNANHVGVYATADDTNRLTVKSDAVLFSHDDVTPGSGSIQHKLNKATAADIASVLFQDNWSARAEFGLTGDDDWHVKVSPDGSNWFEALVADKDTGVISFPNTPGREILIANRDYYVRTDGSDGNNGLSDNAGGAFLTIGAAVAAAGGVDPIVYNVTINVRAGVFSESIILPKMLGSGTFTFSGAGAGSTTISNISLAPRADWRVGSVTLSGGTNLLEVGAFAQCTLVSNVEFTQTAGSHVRLRQSASFLSWTNYSISGGAQFHWRVDEGGTVFTFGKTVTLSGTPAFTSRFAYAVYNSTLIVGGMTFNGSATGSRYAAVSLSIIATNGGGETYLPGSSNGTVGTGGIYA